MKPKLKVCSYQDREEFQAQLNIEFKNGYMLSSWQIDPDWMIVAVYASQESAIELSTFIAEETYKSLEKTHGDKLQ